MKFSPSNFLQNIKTIVTGGAQASVTPFGGTAGQASSLPPEDGGFFVDWIANVSDFTLGSTTTLTKDAANFQILSNGVSSTNGSTNSFGVYNWIVPRDYDVVVDKFMVRAVANMTSSTDSTAAFTCVTSTFLPLGTMNSTANTLNTSAAVVAGSTVNGSTVTQLSPLTVSSTLGTSPAIFEFPMNGLKLIRDTVVAITLSTGVHNTSTAQLYVVEIVYASDLVAFTEDSLTSPSIGDPYDLMGVDAFGVTLRG